MIRYRQLACAGLIAAIGGAAGAAAAQDSPRHVPGRLLVQFNPRATAVQVRSLLTQANARATGGIAHTGVQIIEFKTAGKEAAMKAAFSRRPEVTFAELDEIRAHQGATTTPPNDPYYANEWHLTKIAAPTAWAKTTGSTSVIVAILDTGCDPNHPDLAPKYVAGWNAFDNNSNWADVYGHGTKVAGTVGAASNNGSGVASIAWDVKIMPIRISDSTGGGSLSAMASGLTWAADHGARVANISYQVTNSSTIANAAKYFMSKGGVVTVSAGNYSTLHTNPDNPYVLTVSSTDSNDAKSSFSDYGSDVDVSAPGNGIYTTTKGGGYASVAGTSFSAPATAGVAALVISANPNLTGSQVQDIMKKSADDLGAAGWDNTYAWGRINAAKAVAMALSTTTVAADTTLPSVGFVQPGTSSTIGGTATVQVSASDSSGIATLSVSIDGVTLASNSNSSTGAWSWNTANVENGLHNLRVVAVDAAGNSNAAQISVNVYNAPDTTAPVVSITSPANNASTSSNMTISASASDNRAVVRVEFWIDGKLAGTDTAASWAIGVNTRKWVRGAHSIQCRAVDAAGNAGVSQVVTVYK